ncbi:TonB-dependent receptor [Pelomicrobium sp. G1]|uniref:TonB-dependent receptor n=1 Tax=unclassified Pelomicrobium TaxID=2815318 RepID=UPI003F7631E2
MTKKNALAGWLAGTIGALGVAGVVHAEERATRLEAPTVEVIGTTPLPDLGVPLEQVPANVQAATDREIQTQNPLDLSEFMVRNLGSVHVNQAQNNPFQPDVTYRGFTASPLLGNPIGLSVFVDGVRVNEAFGDTVNWDLIPLSAISTINLIPGSNPVFGLNTLGGALAIRTKSGFDYPGTTGQAYAGSFGRKAFDVAHGGHRDRVDWFVTANLFEEDGWRDFSPSEVKQFFAKAGWEDATSDLDFSYTFAKNELVGNGLVPESFLAQRREAIFTHPDETRPELHFFNLKGSRWFGDKTLLSGNAYYRKLDLGTFNGDAEFDDGGTPLDPTDDGYEAENRATRTASRVLGATVQLSLLGELAGRANQLTLGASVDRGRTRFRQLEQEADFTPDRGTVATGPFELDTAVTGRNTAYGLYFTDTLSLTGKLALTLSGRYNRATVRLRDDTGLAPELEGRHTFNRFNPALGLTFNPRQGLTLYGSYHEGFRVPTPVELTCADENDPCALPVGFVADPPLEPVVAKTWEVGARGRFGGSLKWSATAYRTELKDDILFVSTGVGLGFFTNVDKTRRQGIELGLAGQAGPFEWFANYGFVDATFRSAASLFNPVANPLDPAQPATIDVSEGNRLPGIPRHTLKLGGVYRVSERFTVGAQALYASSQFLRGDENNQRGELSGYTVVNLNLDYRLSRHWVFFAKVDNLFDARYETLGAFNRNAFDPATGQPLDQLGPVERFVAPGAPRAGWVGVKYQFDVPPRH